VNSNPETSFNKDVPGGVLHIADGRVHDGRGGYYRDILKRQAGNVRDDAPMIVQDIDIGGLVVRCIAYGNHLFISPFGKEFAWHVYETLVPNEDGDLATIEVVGDAKTKVVERSYEWPRDNSGSYYNHYRTLPRTQDDCYLPGGTGYGFDPNNPKRLPFLFVNLKITALGMTVEKELRFRIPRTGTVTIGFHLCGKPSLSVAVDALGYKHTFTEDFDSTEYWRHGNVEHPLQTLLRHLKGSIIVGGPDALWGAFLSRWAPKTVPMDGLASLYKRKAIAPVLTRLETEAPVDWDFFRWLHDKQTVRGRKNNQLLGAMLRAIGDDYDKMLAALQAARLDVSKNPLPDGDAWTDYVGHTIIGEGLPTKRAVCMKLPGACEKVEEQDAKKDFRLAKSKGAQANGLGVDPKKYPKLRKAIESGDIPIGIFVQPKDRSGKSQPVNREFALWERALKQKGWLAVISKVAHNASRRSTYERDITPWLNALFAVPAYLDKHTERRQKWSAFPKFVESQWELEMGDDEDNEKDGPQKTRKERSAFTPQVDNEARTVHIPYVAVAVSGVRTQWCYSKNYYLFEAGFTDPETGGVVVNDFETKLNGKDDYGLMYFTLTGTETARGYPTFLIIFERRQGGDTFVHFHRVRPCRSKNGIKTPACELVEACYQYMAGNIPAEDIANQQGDLIFIKHPNDPIAAKAKVHPNPETGCTFEFESHRFVSGTDSPLTLHRSAAKTPKNRLGFMHAPGGLAVRHPEHDDIEHLDEGWYEIRRCKSYENNPVGIWSLTID